MFSKADLEEWVIEALRKLGGEASVTRVAEQIWLQHETDLRKSGDLFFTWQYDIRWAAQNLQGAGKLVKSHRSWALK